MESLILRAAEIQTLPSVSCPCDDAVSSEECLNAIGPYSSRMCGVLSIVSSGGTLSIKNGVFLTKKFF
jgi:hypothetical protein